MKNLLFVLLTFCLSNTYAQKKYKTENVFLISTDGFRWQEMFGGADSSLIYNKNYTKDSSKTFKAFWANSPKQRRENYFRSSGK
jgi:hypothetical protein